MQTEANEGVASVVDRLKMRALAVLGALDGTAVVRLTPSPGQLWQGLSAPHAWISRVGTDAAVATVAGALLWLAALWLTVGLLVTVAAALAGRPQGALDLISRRITPALVRRLVIASTGASIVLSPVTAVATANAVTSVRASAPARAPVPASMPGGVSVTSPTSPSPTPPLQQTPGPPLDAEPAPDTVLVAPGDSLWRIAAQRLGPSATEQQIAVGWPYWYRANRQVIGRDPNLLRPGERLTVPASEEGS